MTMPIKGLHFFNTMDVWKTAMKHTPWPEKPWGGAEYTSNGQTAAPPQDIYHHGVQFVQITDREAAHHERWLTILSCGQPVGPQGQLDIHGQLKLAWLSDSEKKKKGQAQPSVSISCLGAKAAVINISASTMGQTVCMWKYFLIVTNPKLVVIHGERGESDHQQPFQPKDSFFQQRSLKPHCTWLAQHQTAHR